MLLFLSRHKVTAKRLQLVRKSSTPPELSTSHFAHQPPISYGARVARRGKHLLLTHLSSPRSGRSTRPSQYELWGIPDPTTSQGPSTSASDFTRHPEKRRKIDPKDSHTTDVLWITSHEQTNPSGASSTQETDRERATHPTRANLEEIRDAPRAVTEHLNAPRWQEVRDRYTVVEYPNNANKEYFFSETWTRKPETPKLLRVADVKAMMRERTKTHLLERADKALREASAEHPDDTDLQKALTSLNTFKGKREAAAEPLAIQLHFTQLKKTIAIVKFANGKLHERIQKRDVIVTNNPGKFGRNNSFRPDSISTLENNPTIHSKQYGSGNDIVAEWHNGVLENGSVVDSNTIHFYGYTGTTNSNNLFIYLKKQGDGKNIMHITDSEQSLARTNKLQQTFFSSHKKGLNKQMEVNEPAQDEQPTSRWRLLAEG